MTKQRTESTDWYDRTTPEPPPPDGERSPWYDTEESAGYLRVSPDLIRRKLKYEIPHRQRGPRSPMFFHRLDLDRWAAANTVQPIR